MNDQERFQLLAEALERLNSLSHTHVFLVEGINDVRALKEVGVTGEFRCIQSTGGPIKAAEYVWEQGKQAVILTDWDRRGGNLAQTLRENLSSLDVRYDDRIRADIALACRPFAKDVESLDSVYALLESKV